MTLGNVVETCQYEPPQHPWISTLRKTNSWSPKIKNIEVWKLINMGVSKNRGTPKSSILIGFSWVFHYKPFILGYPYFWKHPCMMMYDVLSPFLGFHNLFEPKKPTFAAHETLSVGFLWMSICIAHLSKPGWADAAIWEETFTAVPFCFGGGLVNKHIKKEEHVMYGTVVNKIQ